MVWHTCIVYFEYTDVVRTVEFAEMKKNYAHNDSQFAQPVIVSNNNYVSRHWRPVNEVSRADLCSIFFPLVLLIFSQHLNRTAIACWRAKFIFSNFWHQHSKNTPIREIVRVNYKWVHCVCVCRFSFEFYKSPFFSAVVWNSILLASV